MNAYLQQLQQLWLDRSDQERRLMVIAGPLLLLGIIYWGLWQPVQESLAQAQAQVKAETVALAQVKHNANLYASQDGQAGPKRTLGSLSQVASQSAKENNLVIERMQPQGDKLQLWLEDANFDRLISWLNEINQQGVQINALDLSVADEAGMVQVRRLQLSKP
ncbi:type II secretion system protein M [Ferrimonas lipolytica]|uniref:Type II secretion system protein M n=1 Tax=Ferrimonas lipolytica TaxID=2724191 RepID=A0A6H1UII6_9GAMM|nr:type II secretion system protein M [Ferrimonas lipolytica]QIZ78420.1 type II secretion system protein M [Ferrimonas lipolytica]